MDIPIHPALLCIFLHISVIIWFRHRGIEGIEYTCIALYRMIHLSTRTSHPSRRWSDMSASQLGTQLRHQCFNAPTKRARRFKWIDDEMWMLPRLLDWLYMCMYGIVCCSICHYLQYSPNLWEPAIYIFTHTCIQTDSLVVPYTFLAGEQVSLDGWPETSNQSPGYLLYVGDYTM